MSYIGGLDLDRPDFREHEDERRTLIEWIENAQFRSAKVVVAKEALPIGGHYHQRKDEIFFLLSGSFLKLQIDSVYRENVKAPYKITVGRGVWHQFTLEPGSILLGVATEPFDEKDEIQSPAPPVEDL
jgi:mannose-6-phosphate isomerase-like protein (cupin superfamily)